MNAEAARAPNDESEDAGISQELLRLAYRNNFANVLVNAAAATGVFLLVEGATQGSSWLPFWYVGVLFVSAIRIAITVAFFRTGRDESHGFGILTWKLAYSAGLLVAGVMWAILSTSQLPGWTSEAAYMTMVVIAALAGGATGILAPIKVTARVYLALLILAPSISILRSPDYPNELGYLGIIFLLVMFLTHWSNHQVLLRSLGLARQNKKLLADLESENRKIELFNSKLEMRVKERTIALEKVTRTDPLTGLLNRSGFISQIESNDINLKSNDFEIICLTITNLANIGNSLGDNYVDATMLALAGRLRSEIPSKVIAARWTSDNFIFFLPSATDESSNKLLGAIEGVSKTAVRTWDREIYIDYALGRAISPSGEMGLSDAIRAAILAADVCRRNADKRIVKFSPEMKAAQRRRLAVAQELKRALQQNEFHLTFQPIVAASTSAIECQEVLLRWTSRRLGQLSPEEFIPLAEETGDIIKIGQWVLETACTTANSKPDVAPKIAVNASIKQLLAPGFYPSLLEVLERNTFSPDRLIIEVTETSLDIKSESALNSILLKLSDIGVEVHIDDFGTGYSSLSRLNKLPVDAVKIDKSFVQSDDPRSYAIIDATITIARSLGLKTIAEGVEDKPTAERLKALGVDFFQGYYFGRPCKIEDNCTEATV